MNDPINYFLYPTVRVQGGYKRAQEKYKERPICHPHQIDHIPRACFSNTGSSYKRREHKNTTILSEMAFPTLWDSFWDLNPNQLINYKIGCQSYVCQFYGECWLNILRIFSTFADKGCPGPWPLGPCPRFVLGLHRSLRWALLAPIVGIQASRPRHRC